MKKVKTFRAPDMQSALDVVRREMGQDAVILHTKQVTLRKRFPWSKSETEVEITAGLNAQATTTLTASHRPKSSQRSVAAPKADRNSIPANAVSSVPANQASDQATSGTSLAMELLSKIGQDPDEVQLDSLATKRSGLPEAEQENSHSRSRQSFLDRPLTQRKVETKAADSPGRPQPARKPVGAKPAPPVKRTAATQKQKPIAVKPEANNFEARLQNIEKMLLQLGRQATTQSIQEIPNELFEVYAQLIDADVTEEIARDVIFELKQKCRPQDLKTPERTRAILTGMLEQQINCSGSIKVTPGRRKVVALVGATGVGKTTTIAKLAANFKLRQGIKVGLVTVDTYRIAAVEQLKTYAEIMGLPLKVVSNPAEMRQALDALQGLDLVLVDTGGRSPNDIQKLQELKSLLHEAQADEVHLVLNLTSSFRSLESTTQTFQDLGVTSTVLTKLDETHGLGSMLGLARRFSLPVSYLTTGQDVPDDYEPASASRMVRLLLGDDQLN